MAEWKTKLINEVDDNEEEKKFLGPKNFPRYGTSSKSSGSMVSSGSWPKSDNFPDLFFKHFVLKNETLNSIALKYGLKSSVLKRVNKLWNENIFLLEYLLIPVQNPIHLDPNLELVSRRELNQNLPKSQSFTSSENPPLPTFNPKISAQDYFQNFDFSFAKLKKNVEKLEKEHNGSHFDERHKQMTRGAPKREGGQLRMTFYRSNITSSDTKIKEKFEKLEDEMFQL